MKHILLIILFSALSAKSEENNFCAQGAEIAKFVAECRDHFIEKEKVIRFLFLINRTDEKDFVDAVYATSRSPEQIEKDFNCGHRKN